MRSTFVLACAVETATVHLQRLARRWREQGLVGMVFGGEREAGGASVREWSQIGGGAFVLRLVDDPGFGLVYLEAVLPSDAAAELASGLLEAGLLGDRQGLLDAARSHPLDANALAAAALAWRDVDPQPVRLMLEALLGDALASSSWPGALMAAMVLGDRALHPAIQSCADRLPDGPLRDGFSFLAQQFAQPSA